MSTSLATFTQPLTVTPGEYLVCSHQHYHKTRLNERWHRDSDLWVDDEEMREDSDTESESESDSDYSSSSRASRSPSPFSRCGSYHTAMSTPPPECDSREASAAPSTSAARSTASARRNPQTYLRLVEAEEKAASQRSVAQKRTRLEKTASASGPARPIVCQWGGCGERVANGKHLWMHIERVHKPLDGAGESKAAARGRQAEAEADMDVDEGHHAHDEPEFDEDSSDDDWAESPRSGAAKRAASQSYSMDRYQVRIRCRWKRCSTTIQFAGLRRHIESKHSGLRDTSCPKGCGYVTNRPDMMPRHSVKCHYRRPKKKVVGKE